MIKPTCLQGPPVKEQLFWVSAVLFSKAKERGQGLERVTSSPLHSSPVATDVLCGVRYKLGMWQRSLQVQSQLSAKLRSSKRRMMHYMSKWANKAQSQGRKMGSKKTEFPRKRGLLRGGGRGVLWAGDTGPSALPACRGPGPSGFTTTSWGDSSEAMVAVCFIICWSGSKGWKKSDG